MISSFNSFGNSLNSNNNSNTIVVSPVSTPSFNYSISGNLHFLYSLRVLVPGYKGPVVNIRRSSDNTTADFYTDYKQTFFSIAATGGTPFSKWIGPATPYIIKWYDQTGNGNHATNTNNPNTNTSSNPVPTMPPTLTKTPTGYYVVNWVASTYNRLQLTTPIYCNTVFSSFYIINDPSNNFNTIMSANNLTFNVLSDNYGVRFAYNSIASGRINNASNPYEWFTSNAATTSRIAFNNGIDYSNTIFTATNNIINVSGQYYDSSWNRLSLSLDPSNGSPYILRSVGADAWDISARSLNGYMLEIFCHKKFMNTTDMTDYSNNKLF